MRSHTCPAALDVGGERDPWTDYRVDDRFEILHLLRQLRDGCVPVSLNSPCGHALRSQLWALDETHGQMNFSADAAGVHLQPLTHDDDAVAVAYLERVKLQFDLDDLVLVHSGSGCVLLSRLPVVLYRFQRRGSYRVRTVERHAPSARLRHPSIPDMQLRLRIVDFSAGGCALALPDSVPAMQPGSCLQGVRVEIDSDTAFDATLRLHHVASMHGGGAGMQIGCEWLGLDSAAQRVLQRCIDRAQQRRRLLAPG